MYGTVKYAEYQNLDAEIKRTMKRSAREVVLLGYLLRRMMDEMLWTECYDCFDAYLRKELHMDYTLASRFIKANKKYSVNGGMEIDEKWADYSQSVLIEMLNMPTELMEKVTPDMTARQVREVKRQDAQKKAKEQAKPEPVAESIPSPASVVVQEVQKEQIPEGKACDEIPDAQYQELDASEKVATSQPEKSAYGLEKIKYPEGSLIRLSGCGTHSCFLCAQECNIRQEVCYCRYAPLGNPFGCATVEVMDELKVNVGDRCQFVNNDLAHHAAGTNEAEPCCMDCKEDCEYQCQRSCRDRVTDMLEEDCPDKSEAVQDNGLTDELEEIKCILKKEQKLLEDYLEVDGLPEKLMFKQKTIVAALAAMICDLENAEYEREPVEQPDLPVFKNNNQRKEWLRSYKDWGIWYRDDNIGAEYYKYDFDNGARLIAEVYMNDATEFCDDYDSCYLHLLGGPKPQKDQHGVGKWAWHGRYSRYPNSETELVEFLKEVQRNG